MNLIISNSSGKPIYEQITDQIKTSILSGELQEGQALPSMRALARDLRISVITTKRAYEDLERDGFVVTVAGKGCFVAPRNLELMREEHRKKVEEALTKAIEQAKAASIDLPELIEMLTLLYEELDCLHERTGNSMENTMILQVNNLCKNYSQFALQNVSFSLPKGSIMGLIGENGAGKSTTMRLILGLCKPDSGSVSVFGHEGVTAADREQIGVVFDELPFNQTIFTSHLGKVMAGIYQNWDMELYQQYLKRFALPDKKELKEFSRGMKMKLSLAVALSHNAKLLILDEPTSGLDPVVRSEILDIFLEFISDGERSILVSSHITSDLERIADYITFIHQGKVLLSENKDEILYGYGIAKAGREQLHRVDRTLVAAIQDTPYGSEALILDRERFEREYPDIVLDPVDFDEMMVLLCRGQKL